MNILILDDDKQRHNRFKLWFIGHSVRHVYTVKEFIQQISQNQFDYIFLDHDLNDHDAISVSDGREQTGLDAAKALSQLPRKFWPKEVIVHSFNPMGAKAMVEELQSHGLKVLRWMFDPKAELKIN